jgi:F0F1-type ATP synthase membrane subunit a
VLFACGFMLCLGFNLFFTPAGLSFVGLPMTLVELVSCLARPLTLGLRLCANLSGGHLVVDLVVELGGGATSGIMIGCYECLSVECRGLSSSSFLSITFKKLS